MKDFAAIDFETANHSRTSVCSVGIVIVRNGVIVDTFYQLIRPAPNYYTSWATDCHGLDFEDTAHAPLFPSVWSQIVPKIEGLPLIAHNKGFDEPCLKQCHLYYDIPYNNYKFHCTLQAARKAFPGLKNYQLHTVSEYVGYHLTNHHNALADAEACAAIALHVSHMFK